MHITFRGGESLGFRLVGNSVAYVVPSGQADTLGVRIPWRLVAVAHVPVAEESSERWIAARIQDVIAGAGHVVLSFRTSALYRSDLRFFLSRTRHACAHALTSLRKHEWALWFVVVLCALLYLRFAWARHVARQQAALRRAFESGRWHGQQEQANESGRLCLLALGQNVSWYVDLGKELGRNEAYDASTKYIADLHAKRLSVTGGGVSGGVHSKDGEQQAGRGGEGSLMDRTLVNAMLARIEANVAQLMQDANKSRPCRVLFADPFWDSSFSAESHDFSVPCPLTCEYVYGRDTRLMNTAEADGVVFHLPNFGGFFDTKPPWQKWIGTSHAYICVFDSAFRIPHSASQGCSSSQRRYTPSSPIRRSGCGWTARPRTASTAPYPCRTGRIIFSARTSSHRLFRSRGRRRYGLLCHRCLR